MTHMENPDLWNFWGVRFPEGFPALLVVPVPDLDPKELAWSAVEVAGLIGLDLGYKAANRLLWELVSYPKIEAAAVLVLGDLENVLNKGF